MEDEGNNTVKLIAGVVVIVLLFVIGFFVVKGFLTTARKANRQSHLPTTSATPTSAYYKNMPTVVTPTVVQYKSAGHSAQQYYYQSQGSSQSQNQNNSSQSQTQTLPNGMTQSQSQ